jgi:hypothetical protein
VSPPEALPLATFSAAPLSHMTSFQSLHVTSSGLIPSHINVPGRSPEVHWTSAQ